MLKIQQSTSEFGGLWKGQNNSACTKICQASSECWKLDTVCMKKKLLHQALHQDLNVLLWGNSHFTSCLCKFFKSKGCIKNQWHSCLQPLPQEIPLTYLEEVLSTNHPKIHTHKNHDLKKKRTFFFTWVMVDKADAQTMRGGRERGVELNIWLGLAFKKQEQLLEKNEWMCA